MPGTNGKSVPRERSYQEEPAWMSAGVAARRVGIAPLAIEDLHIVCQKPFISLIALGRPYYPTDR
jgi:hypothetical protein